MILKLLKFVNKTSKIKIFIHNDNEQLYVNIIIIEKY